MSSTNDRGTGGPGTTLGKDGHETPSQSTTPDGEPGEESPSDVFHDCISE